MPYLIDSDWTIDQLADQPAAVSLLSRLAPDGIAISIITYMEVYQGILKSPTPDVAEAKLHAFVDSVPVPPLLHAGCPALCPSSLYPQKPGQTGQQSCP